MFKLQCLTLTTDGWTSRAGDSYLSVTAHFINETYKRQLVVLDTFPSCERHTAYNLLSNILGILDNKITCFVRDNAANITAAVRQGRRNRGGRGGTCPPNLKIRGAVPPLYFK